MKSLPVVLLLILLAIIPEESLCQQYNSDSWLSKPHGTVTIIPTLGQRSNMLMTTYSLFPNWEFTIAAYLYNKDKDILTDDGRSSTIYAKYMFYENKEQTGGASVKFGTGMFPGTLKGAEAKNDAFNTYWINFPCTISFFRDKLSWDLMPGASLTRKYLNEETSWGFTYSTRLAWYFYKYEVALVGEVFGTEGQVVALPEFKMGLRWEPNKYIAAAVTYGQEFKGTDGAGFEVGLMIFSPPFACFGKCKVKNKPIRNW